MRVVTSLLAYEEVSCPDFSPDLLASDLISSKLRVSMNGHCPYFFMPESLTCEDKTWGYL